MTNNQRNDLSHHRRGHQKYAFFLLLIACFISFASYAYAELHFPKDLRIIEDDTFRNDINITGILNIPSSVETVGNDAFSGTSLDGVVIPESVTRFGSLHVNDLVYIYSKGNTEMSASSVSSAVYVIGKSNSPAALAAQEASVLFVPDTQLIQYGGFYYQRKDEKLTLLSAVNPSDIKGEVIIPDCIDSSFVVNALESSFYNCSAITSISIPDTLQSVLNESVLPVQAEINWYESSFHPNDFEIIVPEQIQTGQDLSVIFETNDHVHWYFLQIDSYNNPLDWTPNCSTIGEEYSPGWNQHIFYGHDLKLLPGDYYVTVKVYVNEKELTAKADFSVVNGSRPTPPNVTTDTITFMVIYIQAYL